MKTYAIYNPITGLVVNMCLIEQSKIDAGWTCKQGSLADTTGKICFIGYTYNAGTKIFTAPS